MKVLVTGATGFIGSNLVDTLLKKGWKVKILVRKSSDYLRFNGKCEIVFGDITDQVDVDFAVKNVNIVYNLAAVLPYHKLSPKKYFDINYNGLKNILKSCQKNKVERLVHVSTVGVFGSSKDLISEESQVKLSGPYSESKALGDELLESYIQSNSLPIVIIRPTIGYGPGDKRPGFLSLFRLIKKGLFIPLGKGDNFFHTVYIENLIDALVLAGLNKKAIGEDFIIGDEPCPTMKQILNTISRAEGKQTPSIYIPLMLAKPLGLIFDILSLVGIPGILGSQRVKFITENRKYDISKAKKILNYKPKVKLEEGIKGTYKWYTENGYL